MKTNKENHPTEIAIYYQGFRHGEIYGLQWAIDRLNDVMSVCGGLPNNKLTALDLKEYIDGQLGFLEATISYRKKTCAEFNEKYRISNDYAKHEQSQSNNEPNT